MENQIKALHESFLEKVKNQTWNLQESQGGLTIEEMNILPEMPVKEFRVIFRRIFRNLPPEAITNYNGETKVKYNPLFGSNTESSLTPTEEKERREKDNYFWGKLLERVQELNHGFVSFVSSGLGTKIDPKSPNTEDLKGFNKKVGRITDGDLYELMTNKIEKEKVIKSIETSSDEQEIKDQKESANQVHDISRLIYWHKCNSFHYESLNKYLTDLKGWIDAYITKDPDQVFNDQQLLIIRAIEANGTFNVMDESIKSKAMERPSVFSNQGFPGDFEADSGVVNTYLLSSFLNTLNDLKAGNRAGIDNHGKLLKIKEQTTKPVDTTKNKGKGAKTKEFLKKIKGFNYDSFENQVSLQRRLQSMESQQEINQEEYKQTEIKIKMLSDKSERAKEKLSLKSKQQTIKENKQNIQFIKKIVSQGNITEILKETGFDIPNLLKYIEENKDERHKVVELINIPKEATSKKDNFFSSSKNSAGQPTTKSLEFINNITRHIKQNGDQAIHFSPEELPGFHNAIDYATDQIGSEVCKSTPISISAKNEEGQESDVLDLIADSNQLSPEEAAIEAQNQEQIKQIITKAAESSAKKNNLPKDLFREIVLFNNDINNKVDSRQEQEDVDLLLKKGIIQVSSKGKTEETMEINGTDYIMIYSKFISNFIREECAKLFLEKTKRQITEKTKAVPKAPAKKKTSSFKRG